MFTIKKIKNPKRISDTLALCLAEWDWMTDSKEHYWWVAFHNKIWVAYGGLAVYNRTTLYLGPDHVIKEMRGCGLQRKLIQVREKWARKHHYTSLRCVVSHDNVYSANNFIRQDWLLRKGWPGCKPENYYLYFEKQL